MIRSLKKTSKFKKLKGLTEGRKKKVNCSQLCEERQKFIAFYIHSKKKWQKWLLTAVKFNF